MLGFPRRLPKSRRSSLWLTIVRSEEDNPLGLVPLNISLFDHLLWGLSKRFLLLGRILVSSWGLRPYKKVQVFAPHIYIFIYMIDEICSKELYILYSMDRHLIFFFKFMDENTKMVFWDIIEFEPMTYATWRLHFIIRPTH